MLKSVARSSGVRKCAIGVVEQQGEDTDRGRRSTVRRLLRQQRQLQRGYNSIVGISFDSQDVIVPDVMCQMKDTVAGVRMIDDNDNIIITRQ